MDASHSHAAHQAMDPRKNGWTLQRSRPHSLLGQKPLARALLPSLGSTLAQPHAVSLHRDDLLPQSVSFAQETEHQTPPFGLFRPWHV